MSGTQADGGVQLVVVGSIGIDTIETPFERRERLLGGSVSYACAAASFFASAGMVGIVGEDFPAAFTDLYARFGIDTAGLQRAAGRTFAWSGVYEADMINRRTLSTELNVFAGFSPELPEPYAGAPFFLLGNIQPALQLHVLEQARAPRFVAADTMDLWINTAADALRDVIGRVHMLTLNDSEARLLTGAHNLRACARRILEMGPDYVVIKKGEHGSMLFTRDGLTLVPAFPVDAAADPTGAGDAFAGALMGSLARAGAADAGAVRRAMLWGSVVASFAVESFSLDRLAALTPADLDRRMAELRGMMRVE